MSDVIDRPVLEQEASAKNRLRIIDWDVEGASMDAPSFAARFGAGPVPLGETP